MRHSGWIPPRSNAKRVLLCGFALLVMTGCQAAQPQEPASELPLYARLLAPGQVYQPLIVEQDSATLFWFDPGSLSGGWYVDHRTGQAGRLQAGRVLSGYEQATDAESDAGLHKDITVIGATEGGGQLVVAKRLSTGAQLYALRYGAAGRFDRSELLGTVPKCETCPGACAVFRCWATKDLGKFLVVYDCGRIVLWNREEQQELASSRHVGTVLGLEDVALIQGEIPLLVAFSWEGVIQAFRLEDGAEAWKIDLPGVVTAWAVAPDSPHFAVHVLPGTVRVYRGTAAGAQEVATVRAPGVYATSIALRDGMLAILYADGTYRASPIGDARPRLRGRLTKRASRAWILAPSATSPGYVVADMPEGMCLLRLPDEETVDCAEVYRFSMWHLEIFRSATEAYLVAVFPSSRPSIWRLHPHKTVLVGIRARRGIWLPNAGANLLLAHMTYGKAKLQKLVPQTGQIHPVGQLPSELVPTAVPSPGAIWVATKPSNDTEHPFVFPSRLVVRSAQDGRSWTLEFFNGREGVALVWLDENTLACWIDYWLGDWGSAELHVWSWKPESDRWTVRMLPAPDMARSVWLGQHALAVVQRTKLVFASTNGPAIVDPSPKRPEGKLHEDPLVAAGIYDRSRREVHFLDVVAGRPLLGVAASRDAAIVAAIYGARSGQDDRAESKAAGAGLLRVWNLNNKQKWEQTLARRPVGVVVDSSGRYVAVALSEGHILVFRPEPSP